MPNLYGVANAPQSALLIQQFNTDVLCNAGVYTAFYTTTAIVAPSQGWFQAAVWASIAIGNSATIPTGLNFALAIGAGSFGAPSTIGAYQLTASANNYLAWFNITPASQVAWMGAGSTVSLGLNPATNSTTVHALGHALVMLIRAPDQ